MKLLVGLGNPGKQYFNSRHNLGFMVTEMLLQKYNETWKNQEKFHALVQEVLIGNHTLSLMQPHTFMNNSGKSVQSFANYFKIEPKDICVVYDDIALPIGRIRVRTDGGAGGGGTSVDDNCDTVTVDTLVVFFFFLLSSSCSSNTCWISLSSFLSSCFSSSNVFSTKSEVADPLASLFPLLVLFFNVILHSIRKLPTDVTSDCSESVYQFSGR